MVPPMVPPMMAPTLDLLEPELELGTEEGWQLEPEVEG